jgi:hypothetical protein
VEEGGLRRADGLEEARRRLGGGWEEAGGGWEEAGRELEEAGGGWEEAERRLEQARAGWRRPGQGDRRRLEEGSGENGERGRKKKNAHHFFQEKSSPSLQKMSKNFIRQWNSPIRGTFFFHMRIFR